ncbi:hypothetical protein [Aurantiacibacter sp. D1-12]|uniref:hypothetical protein n=1 Tax=Aurantiacibacter sp. D1-12 TaxID=2993658 RepID=UPI00237CA404|nr:hypothetical protein [Aurantiacibacter sp. D1-12]MDE1467301.1 hypothetical protein [Aurantiacibacter sp. D1-12]
MKSLLTLSGAALLFAGGAAQAQDVPPSPPTQVPEPMETTPIPPSDPALDPDTMPSFTDGQIAAFAAAAVQMRELRADETLDDAAREARAQAIVTEAGLDEATYRAIGRAAQADPAIAMRVQQAVNAMSEEPGE